MSNRDFRRPESMSIPRPMQRPNQDGRYPNDSRYEMPVTPGRPNQDRFGNGGGLSRFNEAPSSISGRVNQDFHEMPVTPGRPNQDRFGNGGGLSRFNETPSSISGRVNQDFHETHMYGGDRDGHNDYDHSYRKRERYSEDSEFPTRKVLQIGLAEVLGTFVMLFIGCLGGSLASVTFGLSVALAVQTFGHISGAHLNPSVTIAALIMEEIDIKMAPVYLIGEFLGCMIAVGVTYELLLVDAVYWEGYCVTTLSINVSEIQGLFLEMIMTMLLILVVCGLWDKKNENNTNAAVKLGFCLTGIFLTAGPLTGASLNSFRSLAPAIMSGYYEFHWIYWVGPNIGAVLGALIYKYLLSNRHWQD